MEAFSLKHTNYGNLQKVIVLFSVYNTKHSKGEGVKTSAVDQIFEALQMLIYEIIENHHASVGK